MISSRILVIEDNEDLAFGLANNLEIEGYGVEVARNGTTGLRLACDRPFDLVVLDLMLPDLDGFRVLRGVREKGLDLPVLILSARGEEVDKVRGFRLGADDYVTKPFGILELMARVEALLRRAKKGLESSEEDEVGSDSEEVYRHGPLEIDCRRRQVRRGGEAVSLAPKEFDLLMLLARRNGAVVTRKVLLEKIWGYTDRVLTRTVDTHVAQLRRKLEVDPARPSLILTVRKIGYRLGG